MKESLSRAIVLGEAIIFLAPVTVLTCWYLVFLIGLYLTGMPDKLNAKVHILPALTLIGVVIQGFAWWATGSFVFKGRESLAQLGTVTLQIVYIGAGLAFLGGISLLVLFLIPASTELWLPLSVAAVGLPALIPFIHVAIEHRGVVSN